MAVYFDSRRNSWYASVYYKGSDGRQQRKLRRGFATKKEAQNWEVSFLSNTESTETVGTFGEIAEIYLSDMQNRVRRSTMITKRSILQTKVIPAFRNKEISEITPRDIRHWQDDMIRRGFSPSYLRTLQEQLSAVFNFAVKFYGLAKNPCPTAGTMGSSASEMEIWTVEEFNRFLKTVENSPDFHAAYMILFWTGLRVGELLALTIEDIDFENKTLRVNKSLQRIGGEDVITEPKTPKSNRIIQMPELLIDEIKKYLSDFPETKPEDRLVSSLTKTALERRLKKGIYATGLPDIHPHCLRHSHTALIASLGATPVEAAERLGHENVSTTLNVYSHVLPGRQQTIASELDKIYKKSTGEHSA